MGSSRPAARSLRNLGLACLVAESINGLFFRNCVNFAFPAMECPGVAEAFEEGDVAAVSFEDASIVNTRTGVRLAGRGMPAELRTIVAAGGLFPLLEQQGYIASRATA
jgi:3-isopropylmalate/(R)-2-methylmalate dehydratase small subunit